MFIESYRVSSAQKMYDIEGEGTRDKKNNDFLAFILISDLVLDLGES